MVGIDNSGRNWSYTGLGRGLYYNLASLLRYESVVGVFGINDCEPVGNEGAEGKSRLEGRSIGSYLVPVDHSYSSNVLVRGCSSTTLDPDRKGGSRIHSRNHAGDLSLPELHADVRLDQSDPEEGGESPSMTPPSSPFFDKFKDFLRGFGHKAINYVEIELEELEHVFILLLFGSFVGIPSPPTSLVVRILPYSIRELYVLNKKAVESDDVLGQLSEFFEIRRR